MKALIVGGGIGGLASALALRLRGWDVAVFEQAAALTEVGAGLQISPNGMRVLAGLGVADAVQSQGFAPEAIELRLGASGRGIFRLPLRDTALQRWGAPYIHIHRADLVAALVQRLDEVAPGAVHLGQNVSAYESAPKPRLHVAGAWQDADLIIGADGLHSAIRRQMLGPSQPRYTGNLAWRAVLPIEDMQHPPPPTACVWAGQGRHAVTTLLRGGTMVNFVGMVETPEPSEEGWRIQGTRADVAADFPDWHPTIAEIIGRAETFHRWALFERSALPRWSEGAVALMGDAAHAMLPSMAQGAVQALEDAWLLAAHVSAGIDLPSGLKAYYAQRISRVSRIQKGSLTNARIFHLASPLGSLAFYTPMSIAAMLTPNLFHKRQDWVYSYDVTALAPLG